MKNVSEYVDESGNTYFLNNGRLCAIAQEVEDEDMDGNLNSFHSFLENEDVWEWVNTGATVYELDADMADVVKHLSKIAKKEITFRLVDTSLVFAFVEYGLPKIWVFEYSKFHKSFIFSS